MCEHTIIELINCSAVMNCISPVGLTVFDWSAPAQYKICSVKCLINNLNEVEARAGAV